MKLANTTSMASGYRPGGARIGQPLWRSRPVFRATSRRWAAKSAGGDQRVTSMLDKSIQQTFRASEIVNGLLNFSRTGAAEFTSLDLNHVIEETLKLLEHQFRTSQVQLETSLEQNLPQILGNAGKLQQVFLNLFLNAKDAMAAGGRLRIAIRSNGICE